MSMIFEALKNVFRTFIGLVLVGCLLYGVIYIIDKNKQQDDIIDDDTLVIVDEGDDSEDDTNDQNEEELKFQTITYKSPQDLPMVNMNISRTGTVSLVNQALIGTDIAGNVDEVFIEVGEIVNEGQPLFSLKKNSTLQQILINLDTAEKQLQSAHENLYLVKQNQNISEQSYQLQVAAANMALQQALLNLNSTLDLNARQLGIEDMSKDLQETTSDLSQITPSTDKILNQLVSEYLPVSNTESSEQIEDLSSQAEEMGNNLEYGQRQLQLAQNYYNNQRNFMQIENAKIQIESTLAQIQSQKIATEQNINQLQTQIIQAEAQVKLARIQADQSVVKAPVSGKVMSLDLEVGEKVNPGVNYITVASQSEKEVIVNVSIEQAMKLQKGQTVEITYAGQKMAGKVKQIGLIANPQTRLIEVKVNQIENSESLIANSFLRVDFKGMDTQPEVIATKISLADLVIEGGKYFAKIWQDGQVENKAVEIAGPIQNGMVNLVGGLNDGDEIIVGYGGNLQNDVIGKL